MEYNCAEKIYINVSWFELNQTKINFSKKLKAAHDKIKK